MASAELGIHPPGVVESVSHGVAHAAESTVEFVAHHWQAIGLVAIGIIGLRWLWNKSGKKD